MSPPPVIVFYISGHGFGHAARASELVRVLQARQPDLRVIIRTSAPSWLFARVATANVRIEPCDTDTGLVEPDGLTIDPAETAKRAAAFYGGFERRVTSEAAYLRAIGPTLVLADIPPLAFAAARHVGVPSVAIANFTWDWVYAYYPTFAAAAPSVLEQVAGAYADATYAFRLPIHGGFDAMAGRIEDVPFIARRSARDPLETKELLKVDTQHPLVFWSFGGARLLPGEGTPSPSDVTVVAVRESLPEGLRHEDLVAAADLVVSKPGYGIVSECVAHRKPFLYTSRGPFAEYDVMVAEMPRMLRCAHVTRAELMEGRWTKAVTALLAAPDPPEQPRVDGTDVVAGRILERLSNLSGK